MSRNYIKAGPIGQLATRYYLSREFGLTTQRAAKLIVSAQLSISGMSALYLEDGRRVLVNSLVTVPGKFMIEVE